jgi:ubiquinone/menaquinone biosynthesis C-methylase UbiE
VVIGAALILAGGLAAFLIWWLVFETEGVYLGRRVVVWLYDVYARRYDNIKGYEDKEEYQYLSHPIIRRLKPHTDPLVLDVATGTGRLPLALSQHARFDGYVIGLDASRKMLDVAAHKIATEHFDDYVAFIWGDAPALPFEDNTFDVVTCLEALEFMPDPAAVLREICRVLRPGGLLLTTQRINARWFVSRLWDETTLRRLLAESQIEQIEFQPWQLDYNLVWGVKAGQSEFVGACPVDEVLQPDALNTIVPFPHVDN